MIASGVTRVRYLCCIGGAHRKRQSSGREQGDCVRSTIGVMGPVRRGVEGHVSIRQIGHHRASICPTAKGSRPSERVRSPGVQFFAYPVCAAVGCRNVPTHVHHTLVSGRQEIAAPRRRALGRVSTDKSIVRFTTSSSRAPRQEVFCTLRNGKRECGARTLIVRLGPKTTLMSLDD